MRKYGTVLNRGRIFATLIWALSNYPAAGAIRSGEILKAVTSRRISAKLLDSRTISISDFSGRAQSFPVHAPSPVRLRAHTLAGLEGYLIVIVIQRILDYPAGRAAASWVFRGR